MRFYPFGEPLFYDLEKLPAVVMGISLSSLSRLLPAKTAVPRLPEQLDSLEPRERKRVYKMLNLIVLAHENGSLELKWALGADLCRDIEPLPPGGCRTRGR
jgi:hypothetical protein